MKKKFHILILAYIYPPDAGSGTFRTLYFANNLAKEGAEITVITAKQECFHSDAIVDNSLLQSVNSSIDVIRASVKRPMDTIVLLKKLFFRSSHVHDKKIFASVDSVSANNGSFFSTLTLNFKDTITGLLNCPDQHVGWIPDAIKIAKRVIKQKKIDCIYASGGPWSCILSGALQKKITGIPLVLDFRDPWISNPNFVHRPSLIKMIERKMEKFCIRNADRIITNTEELRKDFIQRYPQINKSNIHTVTNGFEELFAAHKYGNTKKFTLVYAGALYMSRNPEQMLLAIKKIIKDRIIPREQLSVKLVGGISIISSRLTQLLGSQHIQSVVEVIPRVSHHDAIKMQLEADVLILIQLDFPLQIPRKLYEYLSFRKPIVAVTERNGATANIIRKKNLGTIVENDSRSIKRVIVEMYNQWLNKDLKTLRYDKLNEFSNEELSKKIASILQETR